MAAPNRIEPSADCTRLGCGFRPSSRGGPGSCFCADPSEMARLFPDDREREVEEFFERERAEHVPAYPPLRAEQPWTPPRWERPDT